MKPSLLSIVLLLSLSFLSADIIGQKKLLILGSSTSACWGPSTPANCYVNRLKSYYNSQSVTLTVDNRAVGGYTVYRSMPTNFVAPPGRDPVQPYFNITDGLAANPDMVLINYPSNGYDTYSIAEVMQCFRIIRQTAVAAGKPCYITTTQPRTDFTTAGRENLRILKDSILAEFGDAAIDFWSGLADPVTLAIAAPYQISGDKVHLNDAGHGVLFDRVVAKKLLPDVVGGSVVLPVANAGDDVSTTLPANSIKLDGSKSTAPGSLILSYKWELVSGPSGSLISTPNASSTFVNNLLQGTYRFRLTVTNTEGLAHVDEVQVTVNPAVITSTLVANAGNDVTLPYGQATVIRGDNSYATGSTIVSYLWTKHSGPSAYQILNPTWKATWIRYMTAGTYVYRLTITDNLGQTATDDVTVTVRPALVANAGIDQVIAEPASSVIVDASKSITTGLIISSYAWTYVSGPLGYTIASPGNASTLITGLVPGKYVFRLTLTSSTGVVSSDDVMITVNAKIEGALVPIAKAGPDQIIPVGQATVIKGTTSYIPEGSIVTYLWTKYSGPSSYQMLTPTGVGTWVRYMVAGEYVYRLTITDNYGNKSTDDVKITVYNLTTSGTTTHTGQPLSEISSSYRATLMLLYPNPVKSSVNLRLMNGTTGRGTVKIYNTSGALVKQLNISKNNAQYQTTIPVTGLPDGVYTVEIRIGNEPVLRKKLIKK